MKQSAPILVAAVGNPMAGDDIFGHLVAEALQAEPLAGVEVIELDTHPARLLDHLEGRNTLYVVDAAWCPDEKLGRMIDLDWFDPARPPLMNERSLSTHGISVGDQLRLCQRLKLLPPVVRLLAVTIGPTLFGCAVSQTIRARALDAAEIVNRRARHLSTAAKELSDA